MMSATGAITPDTMPSVLVIDDDSDVRALVAYQLQAAGYEVRAAAHGAEGLALQRESPADVIVTDIFMPEKEGIETIRELKELSPRVRIIVMSGGGSLRPGRRRFTTHDVGVVARELGVTAVLQKPFETEELLSSVAAAIGQA